MDKLRALASFHSAISDEFCSDHLKLCVLWYDEVLFENVGNFDENRFFNKLLGEEFNSRKVIKELSDIILPLKKKVNSDLFDRDLSHSRPYPRWHNKNENIVHYTYPEPQDAEQYAHNEMLKFFASMLGVPESNYDVEQAEGSARVAVDSVLLWQRVNSEIPCMLQANFYEKLAMKAIKQFSSGMDKPQTPFNLFEIAVPSLTTVSWREIIRIRRDGSFDLLRNKINYAFQQSGNDIYSAKKLLEKFEEDAINNILEKGRPRVKRVAIESILANIPGLAVNPFSLFFGIRDTAVAAKRNHDLGWFYVLRDINNVADP